MQVSSAAKEIAESITQLSLFEAALAFPVLSPTNSHCCRVIVRSVRRKMRGRRRSERNNNNNKKKKNKKEIKKELQRCWWKVAARSFASLRAGAFAFWAIVEAWNKLTHIIPPYSFRCSFYSLLVSPTGALNNRSSISRRLFPRSSRRGRPRRDGRSVGSPALPIGTGE